MKKLNSNYFILSIILNEFTIFIYFYIFINSGNSAISFINTDFAILHRFFLKKN